MTLTQILLFSLRGFIFIGLLINLSSVVLAEVEAPVEGEGVVYNNSNPFSDARLEVGYSFGRFIGIDSEYGELDLFVPAVFCDRWELFLDARGYYFTRSRWAGSVGVGFRAFSCEDHIFGLNVYYDYLQGKPRGHFNRVGFGVEWLGFCWDLRGNVYIPVGSEVAFGSSTVFTDVTGRYHVTQTEAEVEIGRGFDFEIGAPLFCWRHFRLYGAAGPYYYDRDRVSDIWGGYARLELTVYDYFTFRVRTSYDHVFRSRTQGSIFLTLPFDLLCCWQRCRDCCRELLTRPVYRDPIIFKQDSCCWSNMNF